MDDSSPRVIETDIQSVKSFLKLDESKTHQETKLDAGPKRLNEYPWPKHWTREQKRRCAQAHKRAKKKGLKHGTPQWDAELARAGFKKQKKDNE